LTVNDLGDAVTRKKIAVLLTQVAILEPTKTILFSATLSSFKDFEDAVQFHCATTISGIDGIITRDLKGFKESTIPVYAPEQVFY
jgi:hypothetical protein